MNLPRRRIFSLLLAILAAAGCLAALAAHINLTLFFRAYLFSYLFCLALPLGGLCLLMLHNLTGGEWGDRIRPFTHAAASTLPLLALLFIPICFALPYLFPWAQPNTDPLLAHRLPYLNPTFFFIRAAIYFAIWITLATLLNRRTSPALSAAGLILYLFTMTHAGYDWIMSRDTNFYSTAFGFVITVGQTLAALAFCIILLAATKYSLLAASPRRPVAASVPPLLNDLGNLLLTLIILWTYVSFMQFLVIWMGNTHEDNSWYLSRGLAGDASSSSAIAWRIIGAIILLGQFFIPFYTLLFRKAKQNPAALTAAAAIILATHILEIYWLIAPSAHGPSAPFDPHWIDALAFIALNGLWFAAFLFLLKRQPMIPPLAPEGAPIHE